jgi:hypothetical protein
MKRQGPQAHVVATVPNKESLQSEQAMLEVEERAMEVDAATLIQAQWRGHQARPPLTGADSLRVTVPEGVTEGAFLLLTTPDGRDVEVVLPPGLEVGDEFDVYVGPAARAPPTTATRAGNRQPPPLPRGR